jgi:hypothetical protein
MRRFFVIFLFGLCSAPGFCHGSHTVAAHVEHVASLTAGNPSSCCSNENSRDHSPESDCSVVHCISSNSSYGPPNCHCSQCQHQRFTEQSCVCGCGDQRNGPAPAIPGNDTFRSDAQGKQLASALLAILSAASADASPFPSEGLRRSSNAPRLYLTNLSIRI